MPAAHTAPGLHDHLAQAAMGALAVDSLPAFEAWCRGPLRALVPFGSLLCAAGRLHADLVVVHALHPLDWRRIDLARLRQPIPIAQRQLLRNWLATRRPQIVRDEAAARQNLSPLEWSEFQGHDLRNIAAHGVITPDASQATYFSFSQMPLPLPGDLPTRLELAVPHLHQAVCHVRVLASQPQPQPQLTSQESLPDLSEREWAIASGLVRGLTNAALAQELKRSPNTIKHQLAALMDKLGTANRSETVARILAMGQGVLPVPKHPAQPATGHAV